MSMDDCIQRGMDAGEMNRERGERAQKMWRETSDRYERQGHPRHTAEVLAAEDVKAAFKKEAGEAQHVFLARIANMRQLQARVNAGNKPNMSETMERLDYRHRGLVRRFNYRLASFLSEHSRDLLGRVRNPAQMMDFVRGLHGEPVSGAAKELSDGVYDALEEMRLMFNEAGGLIGKMDNWGLPHRHDRRSVTKAQFDSWVREGELMDLNWGRMTDPLTGRTMENATEGQKIRFLKETYDNIAFGKEARDAVYGRPQGKALYRRQSEQRVLHFKNADHWMRYNKKFGSGDPFASLMGHVHQMARDITLMREYGPNPGLGVDYEAQLWRKKARDAGDEKMIRQADTDSSMATRMFRILSGGSVPQTAIQDWTATFFSSARHVLTSAMLDRAIFASISDLNSMRLAASSVGMNPTNLISRHVDLMKSVATREDMKRAGWIADTLSDAGTVMARFQQEWAPSEIAERLSSASMRAQGLSHWTDMARVAFQSEMAGLMASQAGRSLDQVDEPLRGFLTKAGITDAEWRNLTDDRFLFKAGNGATFASPMWWREATDMPREQADEVFFKVQGMIEEQMEFAVPTQSLLARQMVDPAAYDLPPGSILYEIGKSGLMFKSFAMTFTVNQFRRINAQPTTAGKIGYFMNLAAGATVMGGLAIQLGDLAFGRDPQDMSDPMFIPRAALKGGGFGIIGDIVSTGQSSWGGGFASYIAGPIPQTLDDVWDLTIYNAWQMSQGEDANFASDLARAGRRYTPLGQTPALGPAMDRLFWDQLQLYLDPESAQALQRATQLRERDFGQEAFWLPGAPVPERAPSLRSALGQ